LAALALVALAKPAGAAIPMVTAAITVAVAAARRLPCKNVRIIGTLSGHRSRGHHTDPGRDCPMNGELEVREP
jgi:hypothetical protein